VLVASGPSAFPGLALVRAFFRLLLIQDPKKKVNQQKLIDLPL